MVRNRRWSASCTRILLTLAREAATRRTSFKTVAIGCTPERDSRMATAYREPSDTRPIDYSAHFQDQLRYRERTRYFHTRHSRPAVWRITQTPPFIKRPVVRGCSLREPLAGPIRWTTSV